MIFCPTGLPKSCTPDKNCSSAPKGQKASPPHPQEGVAQKINEVAPPSSPPHLENPATPVQQRASSPPFPLPPPPPPPAPSKEWQRAEHPPLLPPHSPPPPPPHPQEPAAVKGGKKTPSPPWPPPPPDFLLNCPAGEGCWGTLAHDPPFPPPPHSPVLPIVNEVRQCPLALEEIKREVKIREVEKHSCELNNT